MTRSEIQSLRFTWSAGHPVHEQLIVLFCQELRYAVSSPADLIDIIGTVLYQSSLRILTQNIFFLTQKECYTR